MNELSFKLPFSSNSNQPSNASKNQINPTHPYTFGRLRWQTWRQQYSENHSINVWFLIPSSLYVHASQLPVSLSGDYKMIYDFALWESRLFAKDFIVIHNALLVASTRHLQIVCEKDWNAPGAFDHIYEFI